MDSKQLAQTVNQKKTALQLRMVADGLYVDAVFGKRLLIKTVVPHTELDDYEKKGLIVVAKEEHTPLPSTGIVIMLGKELRDPEYVESDMQKKDLIGVGDMIMFSRYAGTDFQIEQDEYKILDIKEVMCRLKAAEGAPVEVVNG